MHRSLHPPYVDGSNQFDSTPSCFCYHPPYVFQIDYLFRIGKVFDARIYAGLKHWFCRGMPTSGEESEEDSDETKSSVGSGSARPWRAAAKARWHGADGTEGLAAARLQFRWRDDVTERAETARCGLGLLFWCALSSNVGAVLELAAAAPDPKKSFFLKRRRRRNNEKLRFNRPDLFGFCIKGLEPLHAAVAFASWPVVETLLDMGADPMAKCHNNFNMLHSMCSMGRANNVVNWCARFPQWDHSLRCTAAGATALSIATLVGPSRTDTVKALIEAGADPTAFSAETGTTVLHNAAANKDCDEELMTYLLNLPGVRAHINTQQRGKTFVWKLRFVAARALVRAGTEKAILKNVSEWPLMTPLMTAARNGNATVIRLLVEAGADTKIRNARGHTALDLLPGGDKALEESRVLLSRYFFTHNT